MASAKDGDCTTWGFTDHGCRREGVEGITFSVQRQKNSHLCDVKDDEVIIFAVLKQERISF